MPMLSRTESGMVIAIWGQAWVRGADGLFRVLKLGDTLHKGQLLLTAQDAIVQISGEDGGTVAAKPDKATAKTPTSEADSAIEAINKGDSDAAPAAGLAGGADGDLAPGLRVERINEVTTGVTLARSALEPEAIAPLPLLTGGEAGQPQSSNTVTEPSIIIDAVEEGPNVPVGLTAPAGAAQVRIDGVPAVGQLLLADGTPLNAGATLTATQFAGLVYMPPADYLPGTAAGELRYSATAGSTQIVGSAGLNITAVNDSPVATAGAASGAEDSTIPVSLGATDVDGPIAGITITQLPASGTLLLADGVTAVGAGQTLTPAQAASLLYRPDPDAWGTSTIGFVAVDDQGATSTPATWTLTVTPVNDMPVAGADSFAVAEDGSATIAVLANDSDADGDPLTITHVNGTPISDGGPAVTVPNGNVQLVGGQLVFTPAPDYNGPVSFTYTASDGALATSATVSGTVTAVPDAPLVGVDSFTVPEDGSVTIDVRANDSDPDGGTLTITQVNGNAIVDGGAAVAVPGGSVTLVGGQLVLTPAPDFNGPVSFTYTVSNGSLSSTGTVSGTVTPVIDVVTLTLSSSTNGQAVVEGGTITYTATVGAPVSGSDLLVALSNGQTITIPV
ncbi:MAG: tandem-95 repeat protein, partial [Burkholderiaceae bacterium]|nr:tandem-95 repeat protein [Burkholderiaceae bacterium]